MKRADAIRILTELRPTLEARGVAHAGLFGSVARDQAKPSSDVDVVITPGDGVEFGGFAFGALYTILEEAFGAEVDIVLEPIRKASLSEAVARDRQNVF